MDTIEARRIQGFLSEFDVESEGRGQLERAEDVIYMAVEALSPAAGARDAFWLHLGEGPGADLATSETADVETEADLQGGEAILSTNVMVSAATLAEHACIDRVGSTIGQTTDTNEPSAVAEPDHDPADQDEAGGKKKRNRAHRNTQSKRRRLTRDKMTAV
jgi:hypothetical protein